MKPYELLYWTLDNIFVVFRSNLIGTSTFRKLSSTYTVGWGDYLDDKT